MGKQIKRMISVSLITALFSASGLACDAKCEKLSQRALKQYGGTIEKAEKKGCVVKPNRSLRLTARDCRKALKFLDTKYDGYSDLIKSNPKIQAYRERHLSLRDDFETLEKLETAEEIKAMGNSSNSPFNLKKYFN